MHEQLARPAGIVVLNIRVLVLLNIASNEPDLPAVDAAVGFFNAHGTGAEALYFASDELNATLEGVEHLVFEASFAVVGDQSLIGIVVRLLLFFVFLGRD